MSAHNYNDCAKCGSRNHHTIECIIGETPIHYDVMTVKCQEESSSETTQEDASTEGDLINFDEDVKSFGDQSSQTDYHSDLKELVIDPINTKITCELSPATPSYEARFEEDLDEAIRRSLRDLELNKISHQSCTSIEQDMATVDQQQTLSDNEDLEDMKHKSIEKVAGWDAGDDNPVTAKGVKEYQERIEDAKQWEPKATPKTLKNRGLVPKSSFLAFESNSSPDKGRGRMKGQKSTSTGPVTRTLNAAVNTMTVSSLRQKRRDRRNQRSYYDITPELQYLR